MERKNVKCNNCFHCALDPDFVSQATYRIPDNRRDCICEIQPGKKTKGYLPRYCDSFKNRYQYENGKYRDLKRNPIGTLEGDPGYDGPITTVEFCKKHNHRGAKTFHRDGKCMACPQEEI